MVTCITISEDRHVRWGEDENGFSRRSSSKLTYQVQGHVVVDVNLAFEVLLKLKSLAVMHRKQGLVRVNRVTIAIIGCVCGLC